MQARRTLRTTFLFLGALVAAACSSDGSATKQDAAVGALDAGALDAISATVDTGQPEPEADPGPAASDEGSPNADAPATEPDAENPAGLVARVEQGLLRGAAEGHGVRVFKGIPYAAAPVGDLRWKAPAKPASWAGERDATQFGAQCSQSTMIPAGGFVGEEDCLYLNVWVPDFAPVDPAPVMVWIHGGAFVMGSGSEPTYRGGNLAREAGVVVVTINYRLGALGFLAHPDLATEDGPEGGAGVFGLLDQRAALRWVRDNISAFGGDPAKITLFGESAGGMSVCMHLMSPQSGALFHRAIIQSGPCTTVPFQSRAEALVQGERLATELGCADAEDVPACMRAVGAKETQTAISGGDIEIFFGGDSWMPAIDGTFLPDEPWRLLEQGKVNAVPLIAGTNRDEGELFTFLGKDVTPKNEEEVREWLKVIGADGPADSVDEVLALYPLGESRDAKAFVEDVITDSTFVCPTRELLRGFHSAGVPAFRYAFDLSLEGGYFKDLGSFHAVEVPFVFGTSFVGGRISEEDQPVSEAMMGYWGSFALDGAPGGQEVAWPAYDTATDPFVRFAHPVKADEGLKSDICDFWDGIWASSR